MIYEPENGRPAEQYLRPGEKIDDLQRDGLRIIQDPDRFCFGMDAVLLSWYAQARPGSRALDLGTGTGIIPILMSSRTDCASLTGLEIQQDSADMAQRSVRLNALEDRILIRQGDIREAADLFLAASFDVITCNPPYMIGSHGLVGTDASKAIARHEILCTFEDVAAAAARLLRSRGHFYLVHRPFRLAEIITVLCRHHLEPKRMRLVYPFADKEPNMVLLDCVLGAASRLTVEKPLIVYESPGRYTREILDIYYR